MCYTKKTKINGFRDLGQVWPASVSLWPDGGCPDLAVWLARHPEVRKPMFSLGKPMFWCSRPPKTNVFLRKTNIFIRKNAKSCDCTNKIKKKQKIIKKPLYYTKKIKNPWFQGSGPVGSWPAGLWMLAGVAQIPETMDF